MIVLLLYSYVLLKINKRNSFYNTMYDYYSVANVRRQDHKSMHKLVSVY